MKDLTALVDSYKRSLSLAKAAKENILELLESAGVMHVETALGIVKIEYGEVVIL